MRCCPDENVCPCGDEVDIWRNYFLDELFAGSAYKFIPEEDKMRLKAYFMSIPSSQMKSPWMSWNDCISCLLQSKEKK